MSASCWYLYGVAEGPLAPAVAPALTVYSCRDLHAVMRPVAPELFHQLESTHHGEIPPLLADLALQHDQVVRAVFATHDILPMRFGTAAVAPEALGAYLTDRYAAFKAQLDRIRGHAEWGVQWRRPQAAELAQAAAGAPASGRDYLRHRRAQVQEQQAAERLFRSEAAAMHDTLAAVATAACPSENSPAGQIACSYLVPFDRQAAFQQAAGAPLAHAAVRLTGPWPPYSFCE